MPIECYTDECPWHGKHEGEEGPFCFQEECMQDTIERRRIYNVKELKGIKMKVFDIFESINGEVTGAYQGSICTFIRLAGCNLHCSYCDTEYALEEGCGKEMSIAEIYDAVEKLGNENVTITGGEPLCQARELYKLVGILYENHTVAVETNGSFLPDTDAPMVSSWVIDYKLPSSGMEKFMDIKNFACLNDKDFVKFVISNREDFDRAVEVMKEIKKLDGFPTFAFSPCWGEIHVKQLLLWLKESNIKNVVINVQIHKIFDLP